MNRIKIHHQLRHKISGTSSRPRLAVYRSLNHIYAQIIDDTKGVTLVSASSIAETGSLINQAKTVGGQIAKAAKTKKISRVVFDRGGFGYLGAVKALAETARKEGLKF